MVDVPLNQTKPNQTKNLHKDVRFEKSQGRNRKSK